MDTIALVSSLGCDYETALKLLREIGKGEQGVVSLYCADALCTREIAVKRSRGQEHEMAILECKILQYLNEVPYDVAPRQYSWLTCGNDVVSIQEYVPYTLFNWLESSHTREEWFKMLLSVATACQVLQNHRIIHLDVHPGNILYDGAHRFLLVDFGQSYAPGLQLELSIDDDFYHQERYAVMLRKFAYALLELPNIPVYIQEYLRQTPSFWEWVDKYKDDDTHWWPHRFIEDILAMRM